MMTDFFCVNHPFKRIDHLNMTPVFLGGDFYHEYHIPSFMINKLTIINSKKAIMDRPKNCSLIPLFLSTSSTGCLTYLR